MLNWNPKYNGIKDDDQLKITVAKIDFHNVQKACTLASILQNKTSGSNTMIQKYIIQFILGFGK